MSHYPKLSVRHELERNLWWQVPKSMRNLYFSFFPVSTANTIKNNIQ